MTFEQYQAKLDALVIESKELLNDWLYDNLPLESEL